MLKIERNLVLAGVVAMTVCLAGCGNRLPSNAPVDTAAADSAAPAASATPVTPPVTTPVAAAPAYTAPVVTGSLVVSNVTKTKTGIILFKTMHVTGSVVNSSNVPLSGTLKVQFEKNKGIFTKTLTPTSNKTVVITTLQPGQSFPFTVDAGEHNDDDAEVTVDSNPSTSTPAAAAAPATGALPAGAAAQVAMPTGTGYGY